MVNVEKTLGGESVGIPLSKTDWEAWVKPGAMGRVKLARVFGKRVRILELPEGFDEENWCEKGHQGYVLKGSFTITFETGDEFVCEEGDAFVIPDDIKHRSRGTKDGQTVVFVVDEM